MKGIYLNANLALAMGPEPMTTVRIHKLVHQINSFCINLIFSNGEAFLSLSSCKSSFKCMEGLS